MDEGTELIVFTAMSASIAKLAEVYSSVDDINMRNIVHDAALICLQVMTIDDSMTAELMSLDGGKMQ
jgi:hypothetical protein|tara:strand:+ start:2509 stop:2709 length:201 start_codon:yes stop_codon:yes gene_type:complete